MFWIALAAQLTAAIPVNASKWIRANDVPDSLLQRGSGAWAVPVRVHVAPDGAIRTCDVELTSGIADLDRISCRLIAKRAKFQPARSAEGSATEGIYRASIKWAVADRPIDLSKLGSPDLDITVQRLPAGVKSPAFVDVMFLVDASGGKSACAAFNREESDQVQNHAALVRIACQQVMAKYQATPAVNPAGTAIASVQNASVRFSAPRSK